MPFVDLGNTSLYAFQCWFCAGVVSLVAKSASQDNLYDATFTLINGRDQSQTDLIMAPDQMVEGSHSANATLDDIPPQQMLIDGHFHLLCKFNNDYWFLLPPDLTNFTAAIVKNLVNYHEDEQHHNIVLEVDGKDIGAVKFTLCLHSDMFCAMFNRRWHKLTKNQIQIKDVDYDVMKCFVDCLQLGRAEFTSAPIFALKVAIVAKRFAVGFVEDAARDKAVQNINNNNFLNVIDFVLTAMDQESKQTVLSYFFKTRVNNS